MRKRIRAVLAPVVIVTATAGAAGSRVQDSGSGRRLDELSKGRPAAASHFPVDGALAAASQAAAEARWIEGSNARQAELFLQAATESEALEAQRAQSRKAPARTGRGGGGRSCDPESIVQRESKGNPNAVNPSSGAGGKYQFLPSTWPGYGGYARAEDASESVQDERFNEVWAGGAGSSHWGC
jgi:Transglycosylase-like domain